ncbi:PadR family transcriptional regulator [Microtetraspora malaysiensis]|uniref:PadR family transcriptional regulator n=1 Tax=Microtetraspora malaysiensis TaxID=161358 RepID=UPI000AA2C0FE|nr:PadR family transcriptional regulator [Microtetraspora malaysiensis]
MSTRRYSEPMSLRIALLGLLSVSGPASGYDLTKRFETSLAHVWQAGHSQIYPELGKMAADGLITVEAEGARGRKIYTITPDGRSELHRWLTEYTPTTAPRSEIALQAFLTPLLDAEEAVALVERLKANFENRLQELLAVRGLGKEPGYGRYALDLGIRQARMAVGWAADTIADLKKSAPSDADAGHATRAPETPETRELSEIRGNRENRESPAPSDRRESGGKTAAAEAE